MKHQLRPVAALLLIGILALSGCNQDAGPPSAAKPEAFKLTTEYQAVHLDNGQVLFGKLEQAGSDYPLLRDVFTMQKQVNPDTKQANQVLVRRSVELHNPDVMILSARHIVAIEPVAAASRVAQVIKQAETQTTSPTP